MNHDAIVIGAGPAGLISASVIAKSGSDVIVFEEHEKIGEPDHCAGLLSSSGLESLGLRPPNDVIQNTVAGARIFSPSGKSILIERGRREAYVIDRRRFDSWLADIAIDSGAKIVTQTKVQKVSADSSGKHIVFGRQIDEQLERKSRFIVNAEGLRCQVSKSIGLPQVPRSSKYPAYQFEVSGADVEEDLVEMFYGRRISKGFFAWIIPIGDGRARVGLASKDRAKIRLEAAMRHHTVMKKRLSKCSIIRGFGGTVLIGLPVNRTVSNGCITVGDAAGIVKATTGGGVILGGQAAKIAGRVVVDALQTDDPSPSHLTSYEKKWRSLLLRELQVMYLAQKGITSLSDKGVDSLISDASELGLLDIVKQEGDMDRQKKVILQLLRNPRMIMAGFKAIRYLNPLL
ncbi:MAG: geranylgeranyl reductase family protein [Candidatus Thorarchaeota archaeon]